MAEKENPSDEGVKKKEEVENEKSASSSKFKEEEIDKNQVEENLKELEIQAEEVQENNLQVIEGKEKLALTTNPLNYPIKDLETPAQLYTFAKVLVGGKLCPFKEVQDVVIVLIAAKELGLSLTSALGGIHPIEGRASLGVHIKKAILLNHNIIFRKVRDFETFYYFTKNPTKEQLEKNPQLKPKLIKKGFIDERPEGDNIKAIAKDTKTVYLFTRYFQVGNKHIKNIAYGEFSLSDASNAGLLDKNNWKNYAKDMLASRAFSRGSNEIADDLLHGMYSHSELADLNDSVEYYIDENGHEQIIN